MAYLTGISAEPDKEGGLGMEQWHEVNVCSRSLRPSTSLRDAQGERGKDENRRNLPFMLSVAA
jgi:hypothetical protein